MASFISGPPQMAARAATNSALGNHPRLYIRSRSFPLKEGGSVEHKGAALDSVSSTTDHNEGLVWELK